jgi:glycosyltransferase involved in cell wall biosynthesis
MPLPSDEWSKGKCGFKIIQYFALGIPAIASPVGENLNIVQHGVNGLLAKNFSDWENYLKLLLKDHDLRNKMGINGYKLITEKYSISANNSKYLKLFSLNFNFKSKS